MSAAADRAEPTHPRPQLARDGWVDLCGRWRFAFDDHDRGRREGWHTSAEPYDREIVVPYPPESKLSQVHDKRPRSVVWYRRELDVRTPGDGRRVVLHLGAVDYQAQVWVNGVSVAEHEGGHTPFSADVTEALDPGGRQAVVVRAEDRAEGLEQPRGKQDWQSEPHRIWYHRTTGIWQPVWFEVVGETHLVDLHWSPDIEHGAVRWEARLNQPPPPDCRLDIRLTLNGDLVAEQTVRCLDDSPSGAVSLAGARNDQAVERLLWSPENPTLIEATVTVRSERGTLDHVSSYLGYRSVAAQQGRFLLNGRPYYLRMALEQGYWPTSHLAAPDEAALVAEVELAKELGFNGVRIHQKVEDPRFLHWCDRLGLVVWAEMPSVYTYSATSVTRLTREWLDVVRRDRSHPCVVAWVPLNESWGVRWIRDRADQQSLATGLYHLTRALDPSRPVVSNDGWEHTVSDIVTFHDYAARGAVLEERYGSDEAVRRSATGWGPGPAPTFAAEGEIGDRPVMVTEFGGINLRGEQSGEWGYTTVKTAEEFLGALQRLFNALKGSPALSGFCYTQLTDTEQETNGLLTAAREHKLPVEQVRRIVKGRVKR